MAKIIDRMTYRERSEVRFVSGGEAKGGLGQISPSAADEETPPPGVDITKPHVARMYDYYLGGTNNYAADREAAERYLTLFRQAREGARANRRFLIDAVRRLIEEAGIRQFIDIGSGLPTQQNVHEVAQKLTPDARVVYVDNDPLVRLHAETLLAGDPNTAFIEGDLRDPQAILNHPALTGLVDLSRPVGLLLLAVLHFIEDLDAARACVRTLCDRLPSGSYLVLSHSHAERRAEADMGRDVYRSSNSTFTMRAEAEIARFFEGLTLVEPGLVPIVRYEIGDDGADAGDAGPVAGAADEAVIGIIGGIARIDH